MYVYTISSSKVPLPKSATTHSEDVLDFSKMFSGFKSQCIIPSVLRYLSAWRSYIANLRIRDDWNP